MFEYEFGAPLRAPQSRRIGRVVASVALAAMFCCVVPMRSAQAAPVPPAVESPGALSDELQIVSNTGAVLFDAKVFDPIIGPEPILAFANTLAAPQDYSATMAGHLANPALWLATVTLSAHVAYLTEPGTGGVSDVLLSFRELVAGRSTNVVAMISDPTQVSAITTAIKAIPVFTPASVQETGYLQNVTSLLYPNQAAPFTVNVLSTVLVPVPEPATGACLLAGIALLGGFAARRRRA